MKIERIELRIIEIPLSEPFEIASHRFLTKSALLIKAWTNDGLIGWAEGEHLETPWYVPETVQSGWALLSGILLPQLLHREFVSTHEIRSHFNWIQGNQLSLAAVDVLAWDLLAQAQGLSLAKVLGGVRDKVPAGTSLGLCASPEELLAHVRSAATDGYKRVKIKIKPGKDLVYLQAVRREFPVLPIMADANCAYTPEDMEHLAALDDLNLMMIEQPFMNGDLTAHAALAKRIKTPVCLDESIHSLHEAKAAVALGACGIVNIKPPRIGGPSAVQAMEHFLREKNIPVWCGGMLETGLGRAVNLACAALEGFSLPGDLAAPMTYLEHDIVHEDFALTPQGSMCMMQAPGIGVQMDEEYIKHCTRQVMLFK